MTDKRTNGQEFEDITVRDLFSLPPGKLSDPGFAAGLESEDFQSVRKQLSSLHNPIAWSSVQTEMESAFSSTLNTSVLGLWARGWEKYRGLMDDVEKSRKSPNAAVLSPLDEHSIDSTLHPYIQVFLGAKQIQKIKFDVVLTTQIKGLLLGLKAGKIVSLQLAECAWTGAIRTKDITLIRRDLQKLTLPGRIELKRGIPLG